MVSITTNLPQDVSLERDDLMEWLARVSKGRSEEETEQLRVAGELAFRLHFGGVNEAGEDSLRHALAVADILAGLSLDTGTLVAAILHDALATCDLDLDQLQGLFGSNVTGMVRDMARIGELADLPGEVRREDEAEHKENLRRMLLSIADDIRVLLVVLAERLHKMRLLKNLPEEVRIREASETRDIYAPLANRLGIWQIKWEMEDLCLRYLEPAAYKEIAGLLDGCRADRERFIKRVLDLLQERFAAIGIQAEISGRPKHIYSIWKKMKRKAVGLDQIFDLRAVRVVVDSVGDCYGALGVVHGLWKHIPGEFDDYIATPKPNMYRSIHTAVIGPGDKTLEIQIRTHEMHEHSELGVAAHWNYKENRQRDAEFEHRAALMRSWLESKNETSSGEGLHDHLKPEFESPNIYVLTPKGKVIELPKGATSLDFAYGIHSDVGHCCRGAMVNGRITQLTQPLESGQVVEILTAKDGVPSRDWLSPHLGYLQTSRARSKVKQWFKHQDFEQHLNIGCASLEREVIRLGAEKPDLEAAAKRFNLRKPDDLLAAIGRGDISPIQVAGHDERQRSRKRATASTRCQKKGALAVFSEVIVEGVGDLMTHMGRCCKPVPSDPVIGFITRGRGVTVHRQDCSLVQKIAEVEQERLVRVAWTSQAEPTAYPVDIRVEANDRKGLLRDISALLANEEVDVAGVHTRSDPRMDRAIMRFTVDILDMTQLSRVLDKIAQLPDVQEVRRKV